MRPMRQMLLCLIVVLTGAGMGWAQATTPTTSPTTKGAPRQAAIIPIEEEIDDYTFTKLEKRFEQAKRDGVDTIILRINTPGGLVGAALDITRLIKSSSDRFHTVAYVDKMAYSAGSMIAVSCNEIVMSPNSMIGDCAPILPTQDGLATIEGANRAKLESPLVADFEDSAERNGHDPLLLRSFVQYQLTIYVLRNDAGQILFATKETLPRYIEQGWKLADDIKNPIDDELTLLTVNNTTAAKLGLSKGTYASVEAFAASRGWTVAQAYEPTGGERVIEILSGNVVRGLMGLVFGLSILMMLQHFGTGVYETSALISGAFLFGVPLMTGYASWIEIVLVLIGISLLAVELFLIPGFGVTGVTGIILILAGMVMTFVPSEAPALPDTTGPHVLPQLPQTRDGLKEGLIIVTSGMAVALGLWVWLARYLPSVPYLNRLVLQTTVGSTAEPDTDPARELVESAWPTVGSRGTVVTDLRPGGMARFFDSIINDDRNIDVISDTGFVAAGKTVVVKKKQGSEIVVREVV